MLGGERVWAEGLAEGKSESVSRRGRKGRRAEGAEKGDKGRGSSLCEGEQGDMGPDKGMAKGAERPAGTQPWRTPGHTNFWRTRGEGRGTGSC